MNDENKRKIEECQSKLFDEHVLNVIEEEYVNIRDGVLCCDEFHIHSFDCINFRTNETFIIKALIENIRLANKTIDASVKVLQCYR